LQIAEKTVEYICALKLHHDIIEDFDRQFVQELQRIAEEKDFLVFEDRKYADTGNTMRLQMVR